MPSLQIFRINPHFLQLHSQFVVRDFLQLPFDFLILQQNFYVIVAWSRMIYAFGLSKGVLYLGSGKKIQK